MTVLDASALIAFLFREPGHERVASAMARACVSSVNLAEVLGYLSRDGRDPTPIAEQLTASQLDIVPFSVTQALICARLLPHTRAIGLSLGDRACLALALERDLPALTADRAWGQLDLTIRVDLIR